MCIISTPTAPYVHMQIILITIITWVYTVTICTQQSILAFLYTHLSYLFIYFFISIFMFPISL